MNEPTPHNPGLAEALKAFEAIQRFKHLPETFEKIAPSRFEYRSAEQFERRVRLACPFSNLSEPALDALGGNAVAFLISPKMVSLIKDIQRSMRPGFLSFGVGAIELEARPFFQIVTFSMNQESLLRYMDSLAVTALGPGSLDFGTPEQNVILRITQHDIAFKVFRYEDFTVFSPTAFMADIEPAVHHASLMSEDEGKKALAKCLWTKPEKSKSRMKM